MPLILGTNSIKDTGYEVANSCRFNKADTPSLSITPGSNGSNTVWTISMWCKRSNLSDGSNDQKIHAAGTSSTYELLFSTADQLTLYNGSTTVFVTNRKFRDVSAWYHIVVAYNTGASGDDRCKVYINGTQETSFATDNRDDGSAMNHINQSVAQFVGNNNAGDGFDGYIAEVCVIDGTAYAASSFGEFNEDSPQIWQPIDVSELTFGTNGAYFDFESSGNLGNDANGGTDWTETNLAATDQSSDSPTNSFCTFNPLYNFNVDPTYSEGNCLLTFGSTWGGGKATMAVSTGKWYWEAKLSGTMANHFHGIQEVNVSGNLTAANPMNLDGSVMFFNQDGGEMRKDDTDTTNDYGTFSDGDIIGIALNMDGGSYGQITIYKNGSAIVSNYDLSSTNDLVAPFTAGGGTMSYNFGGSPSFTISSGNADGNGYGNFEYAVPSGFYALCTKNLAEFG